jgi:fructose-1,6-bisphosphatase/inositol monophosphatase family enzyme
MTAIARRLPSLVVDPAALLDVLYDAVAVVQDALTAIDDWRPLGDIEGQYALDLVADGPVCDHLVANGLGVLSEESGLHHPDRQVVVVVDPVDGSTNASRRIPYYATSLCAVDADGAVAGVVVNLATGERFDAIRGAGARLDGMPIESSTVTDLDDALIAFNGLPDRHWGWAQYRAFGAAALDLCAVACGRVDAYDSSRGPLKSWDYLAGALICTEAGVTVVEARDRDLVVLDPAERRAPIAAATPELLAAIRGAHTARS